MTNFCVCCASSGDNLSKFHANYVRKFFVCFSTTINQELQGDICLNCIDQLNSSFNFKLLVIKTQISLTELKIEQIDNASDFYLNHTSIISEKENHEKSSQNNDILHQNIVSNIVIGKKVPSLLEKYLFGENAADNRNEVMMTANGKTSLSYNVIDGRNPSCDNLIRNKLSSPDNISVPVKDSTTVTIIERDKQELKNICIDDSRSVPDEDFNVRNLGNQLVDSNIDDSISVPDEDFNVRNLGNQLVDSNIDDSRSFPDEDFNVRNLGNQLVDSNMEQSTNITLTCDFKCKTCDKVFTNQRKLKLHELSHLHEVDDEAIEATEDTISLTEYSISDDFDPNELACPTCQKTFNDSCSLSKHMEIHHLNFICESCGYVCMTLSSLGVHKLSHTEKYICNICSEVLPCQYSLKSHLFTKHNKILLENQTNAEHEKPTPELGLNMTPELRIHERQNCCPVITPELSPYIAPELRPVIRSEIILDILPELSPQITPEFSPNSALEFNSNATAEFRPNITPEFISCNVLRSVCNKEFNTNVSKNHISEPPSIHLLCDICGKRFTSKQQLTRHIKTHSESRTCTVCGEKLSSLARLNAHFELKHSCENPRSDETLLYVNPEMEQLMSVHNLQSKKSFICTICGQNFHYSCDLSTHMLYHRDKSNYQQIFKCKLCPGEYKTHEYLLCHMNSHTGERPYKCKLCPKMYRWSSSLRNHRKMHRQNMSHNYETVGTEGQLKT